MAENSATAHMDEKKLDEAAQRALQLKEKQHADFVRANGVLDFVASAKHSLLFQPNMNWNDMLSGAPISISVMGAIFIASTTTLASGITLLPPTGGFKNIE
ncbi:hypothetical protein PG997_012844 [Apiospora hydei]|uniref:Uncharacterized protein n=1 Tax=Apiospora hydei TaxID=1337664 RepID=A0ABR1V5B6_9PEZI